MDAACTVQWKGTISEIDLALLYTGRIIINCFDGISELYVALETQAASLNDDVIVFIDRWMLVPINKDCASPSGLSIKSGVTNLLSAIEIN